MATSPNNDGDKGTAMCVPLVPTEGGCQLLPVPIHPGLSAPLDATTFLRALRRRWPLALFVGLACAASASFAVDRFMPPPQHKVRSILQISAAAPKIFFAMESQFPLEQYQRTQLAVVKSRTVLGNALQQPEVASLKAIQSKADPVLWLETSIKADFTVGPEMLSITLNGDDPDVLVPVVNAVAHAYVDVIAGKDHQKRQNRLLELKDVQSRYAQKAAAKQKALSDLALAVGSRDVQNLFLKQRMVLEELIQAKRQLASVQTEIKTLKARAKASARLLPTSLSTQSALFDICPAPASPVLIALAGLSQSQPMQNASAGGPAGDLNKHLAELPVSDSEVDDLLKKDLDVLARKKTVDDARNYAARVHDALKNASNEPIYKGAIEKLAATEKEYAKFVADARKRIVAEVRERKINELFATKPNSPKQAGTVSFELSSWLALEKMWLEDVSRLSKESEFINQHTVRLEAMGKELANDEDLMRKIGSEVEGLEVEQRAPSRVTELEQAVLYPGESGRKQLIMVGGAGAGTFASVLFLFAWCEFRRRRVTCTDEVVHGLGIRLVGTVPDYKIGQSRRFFGPGADARARFKSSVSSSIDATRTMLLHAARQQHLKVVLITSAMGGEGKTSLAAQLGASLARAGRKTLLVDADLRKPTLHRLLHVPRGPGFSDLLQGRCTIDQVTQPSSSVRLSLITAGQTDEQAIQALAQEDVSGIFEQLRQQYDFIVVDCSPILPVPDSLTLAPHADAAILSVLRDVSTLPTVYAAYQRLSYLGLTILGAVVNGVLSEGYYSNYLQPITADESSSPKAKSGKEQQAANRFLDDGL
jgi:polysaccharide biosynthesis transport protein